jgi:cytochrome c-type protein NapB
VKKAIIVTVAVLGPAFIGSVSHIPAVSAEEGLTTLRGEASLPATSTPPRLPRQKIQEGSFDRAWKEQPPLVPHRFEKYEIDLKVNQCLRCHDRPYYKQEGATEISDSHYMGRDGKKQDTISGGRWFCTQCHVPQADLSPLVENIFEGTPK